MARPSLAEKKAALAAQAASIKAQMAQLEAKEAERIGRLAVRAGLADLDISDEQLAEGFAALAAKFSGGKAKPAKSASASA